MMAVLMHACSAGCVMLGGSTASGVVAIFFLGFSLLRFVVGNTWFHRTEGGNTFIYIFVLKMSAYANGIVGHQCKCLIFVHPLKYNRG